MENVIDTKALNDLLQQAKSLAQRYHRLTGKPLGITGEVAEFEASRILGVELAPARQSGFDATEFRDGCERKLQIKGRCLQNAHGSGGRIGSIKIDRDWTAVLLVLMDANYDAIEIWEADQSAVLAALSVPGSKARNERGALSVSKFRSIGRLRWERTAGLGPRDAHGSLECDI